MQIAVFTTWTDIILFAASALTFSIGVFKLAERGRDDAGDGISRGIILFVACLIFLIIGFILLWILATNQTWELY
jgi:hypothetical protein